MNASQMLISLALLSPALATNASHAKCVPEPIKPNMDRLVIDGAQDASLGEADNAARPTAWQGPISSGSCMVEAGIIEEPFLAAGKGKVYFTTYSGSQRNLILVDLAACKVRWRSKPFTGAVKVEPDGLKLGSRKIRTDGQCVPMEKS